MVAVLPGAVVVHVLVLNVGAVLVVVGVLYQYIVPPVVQLPAAEKIVCALPEYVNVPLAAVGAVTVTVLCIIEWFTHELLALAYTPVWVLTALA